MTSSAGNLLYFAYGSNMLTRRLARRVADVQVVGPARLPGHRLAFDKRGLDGSGKAAVQPSPTAGAGVHGVLFEVPAGVRRTLDRIEGGYRPAWVEVDWPAVEGTSGGGGATCPALTYLAVPDNLDPSLRPFCWYRDFVVWGAREHGLPEEWVLGLETVCVVDDPDRVRLAENRAILRGGGPDRSPLRAGEANGRRRLD